MGNIAVVAGAKENIIEDIRQVCRRWGDDLDTLIATGKDIRSIVIEQASALFVPENLVLVIIDPEAGLMTALKRQIDVLAGKARVLIYVTGDPSAIHKVTGGDLVTPEQEREKRIQETVRMFLRKYEKKMTHEAFSMLTSRIRDASILESELMKLVNFVGERKDIKSKDILAVVTETHEDNLFTLFDAIAKRDEKEVLSIFENLMVNGVHILAIHSYLCKQVRLLLQAKDMEAAFRDTLEYQAFAKAFNRWKEGLELKPFDRKQYLSYQKPYYAYNLSKTSRRLGKPMLISFLNMLTIFERDMKSGTKYDRVRLECGLLKA